jgi:hypothetical protein
MREVHSVLFESFSSYEPSFPDYVNRFAPFKIQPSRFDCLVDRRAGNA